MIRRNKLSSIGAVSALAMLPLAFGGEPQPGGFDIPWHTIDGGGATFSTGGGFQVGGTIGQPDASSTMMTGGGFALTGGFWAISGPGIVPTCFGDIAPQPSGDSVVNTADLLAVINAWGACPGCPADLNNDLVVNTADLLAIINAWGPCP